MTPPLRTYTYLICYTPLDRGGTLAVQRSDKDSVTHPRERSWRYFRRSTV